ncbi:P-loop containing nucleoside triphosphate hydrolase protein [Lipomyces arxii]|uniref:P-loop containing nucleoside triphosphate hydrolase protein n=1 Tax=Lipomyces arxii TaxID=56418 RepID=UPI0034D01F0C
MASTPLSGVSPHKLSPISHNVPHGRNFTSTPASKRTHTFTPTQIKSALKPRDDVDENSQVGAAAVDGAQSEFSGKQWVWLTDPKTAFTKGFVTEEDTDGMLRVRCTDDSDRVMRKDEVEKVNPPKFDKANDMAELTYLNEPSVIYNLASRYMSNMIYTYSGLFLVAVNPYCSLPLYNQEFISKYKNRSREDAPPHIYATADLAFRRMLEMHEDQSILVTGESGAGKTENTKKVIQYLAAITATSAMSELGTFEQKILQANPILEAFGNSQTMRNNNSSRFGKFIKIKFSRSGQISGAYIDWYLLEKSRVVTQSPSERNYHIFYQLLHGAPHKLKEEFLLKGNISDYAYVKHTNRTIPGVSDADEFRNLVASFRIMGFTEREQHDLLRVIAVILHIGNLEITEERSSGQAKLVDYSQAERLCHVMGVPVDAFVKGLLRPRVKAGRDWVDQSRTAAQVQFSLNALATTLYERGFGFLVRRINDVLEQEDNGSAMFIGVLDIAGFEIFEHNSFEQLCINYTNEKLQQFFNHHMFVLEQEEYAKENIDWKFIDFGHDLQPTIDLIEKSNPIGIFSCLDEDCVMPRATDKSFTDKLHSLWAKKSDKYKPSLFNQGFRLTHYAAEVEYSTEGWLEKNKDPMNDNIVQLLSMSSERHIAALFSEDASAERDGARRRKGLFRTVAQRHKEQLTSLMMQLNSTHPHFVRCILPNHEKRPRKMDNMLVLDQLRCNGVLEGIRIARTGFPNRLSFTEFRQRYEVLVQTMRGFVDGQKACRVILDGLGLDAGAYRVGNTKVFFRAGVLAELEERREKLMREIMTRIQSRARGYLQRRYASKRLYRADAVQVIKQNLSAVQIQDPWWKMYVKMQPLLLAQRETVQSLARDEEYRKVVNQLTDVEKECDSLRDRARRAESESKRIVENLESERALALDKEEILTRTQAREADLEEQLAIALEDLDKLEGQCEELLEAKRKADDEVRQWRTELEKGARIIGRLEGEKGELEKRLALVDGELQERDGKHEAIKSEMKQL